MQDFYARWAGSTVLSVLSSTGNMPLGLREGNDGCVSKDGLITSVLLTSIWHRRVFGQKIGRLLV